MFNLIGFNYDVVFVLQAKTIVCTIGRCSVLTHMYTVGRCSVLTHVHNR